MPVTPRYDWDQDFKTISIQIHGPRFSLEHLQVADLFVGLSSAPYLLGLDLYQSVKSDQCNVRLLAHAVQLQLPKSEPGLWPDLCLIAPKHELHARRKQTIELARERDEERRQLALQQKANSKKNAQQRIWNDEDRQRSLIEQLKQKEESEAKVDVELWAQSNEIIESDSRLKSSQSILDVARDQSEVPATFSVDVMEGADQCAVAVNHDDGEILAKKQNKAVPAIRSNPVVLVRFKATNDRAGAVARDPNEDDEFAVCPAVSGSVDDVTDAHAELLHEKGRKFQQRNDFLSAISAFTAVLQIKPSEPSALLDRARCYLKLASLHGAAILQKFERIRKCIADCNLALAQSSHYARPIRSDLYRTRAQANTLLGGFPSAISDFEDAQNLSNPENDQELGDELDQVSKIWSQRQNQRAQEKDELDLIQDIDCINDLVNMHPTEIDYLMRRAQIRADLGQHGQSLDDLTECMAIIDDPALGRQISDERLDQTYARIYQLRGLAHLQLEHHWQADEDFSAAIRHGLHPDLVKQHQLTVQDRLAKYSTDSGRAAAPISDDKDQLHSLIQSAAIAFQQRDASRAQRLYNEALRLNPPVQAQAQILSNRAATELYLQQYDASIRDSTASLQIADRDRERDATTLSRRASAYAAIGSADLAQDDLRAALPLLDPGSSAADQIKADLQRLS